MERRIAIAGSTGLIGSALSTALVRRGDSVAPLRRPQSADLTGFDLTGYDAVINLAGSPIAGQRWNGVVKQQLRDSRIESTAVLADAVAAAGVPVFLCASAVGFYGDAGEAKCFDGPGGSAVGTGFLAALAADWEATARTAGPSARVVNLRFGHVLAAAGGMLPSLRRIYRLGLGGRLGSGHQWFPWIVRDDAVRAILHVLDESFAGNLTGPVNVTGPNPVRQQAFSEALGRELRRPARWVVPRFALKAAVGEIADEALLTSTRAIPQVLLDSGFRFGQVALPAALAAAIDDEA